MLDAIVECLVERNKTIGIRILNFLVILFDTGLVMASVLVFLFFPQYFRHRTFCYMAFKKIYQC